MARLLIVGASGLLGRHVAAQAHAVGWGVIGTHHSAPTVPADIVPYAPIEWRRLDIRAPGAVADLARAVRPDAVVHVAYQQRGPTMWAITAQGAAHVALAAAAVGARLIHLSSDALFDGRSGPYDETAPPSPITPYGAAKAAADTAVAAIAPGAAIVRTSLILSHDPPDQHTRLILDIAAGRRQDRLFTDEYRCPVAVEDLAAAILELLVNGYAGVINVAGPDAVSRHELGVLVAAAHGLSPHTLPAATVAASGLHRPADVRLDSALARHLLRTRLRGARAYISGKG